MPVSQASLPAGPKIRESGFSLVELMIALGIGTILLALAFPDFMQSRANDKIRAAAAQLQQDMQWARAEAIKRNQRVGIQVYYSTDAKGPSWIAYTVSKPVSPSPYVDENSTPSIKAHSIDQNTFQNRYQGVTINQANSANTYDVEFFGTLGQVFANSLDNTFGGQTYRLAYSDTSVTNRKWLLVLAPGGRIVTCIESSSTPGSCQ